MVSSCIKTLFTYKKGIQMEKTIEKDHEIISETIGKHERLFYKMAYTYMRNHHDAQDVLHNAYEKAYKHQMNLRDKEKVKSWMLTIIRHEANHFIRKKVLGREVEKSSEQLMDRQMTDNIGIKLDLKTALYKLSDEQRDMVVMKYLLGYKQKEIAFMFDVPIGTVKSKTARALEALKALLGGDFNA